MGLMVCRSEGKNDAETARSKMIERQLKDDRKHLLQDVKLLLLGSGDSGKSTFAKQMRIVHKKGLPITEYAKYQGVLRENCLNSMIALLNICEALKTELPADLDVNAVKEAEELTPELAKLIQDLWNVPAAQQAFSDRGGANHIQILSSAPYFFTNAERFAAESFRPSDQDVTMAKLRTTGIVETTFSMSSINFTLVDVGGQRCERRKWLHCFDSVTAVIYLAALDEYNMTLEEDNSTNRLEESLRLFTDVVGSPWFAENTCILFLNKEDLFAEKIKRAPLNKYFDDINESDAKDLDKSIKYVQSKYEQCYVGNRLYCFTTCAVDVKNCERVFNSVRDAVLQKNMDLSGV